MRLLMGIPTGIFLFGALMLANLLQMLSLVIYPFSRHAFRKVNRTVAHCWWGLCVLWAEHLHRIKPVFSGDDVPDAENAIVVANHQQMPDIVALMMFAWRKKRLGDLKWFVKDVIKYVPGVGWGMIFLDCIFLKRAWDKDENRIRATFSRFLRDRIPVWLVSFPEGTRITPSKLAKAQEFSRGRGEWIPQRVLVPRARGFAASVLGMREHITAVYDVTIGYPGRIPTLGELISSFNSQIHIHVRRHPIASLPKDQGELGAWITDRFKDKDRLLEAFTRQGHF
jgi:1-acyl-sn-glycerol-3-phosphate acyltransferase